MATGTTEAVFELRPMNIADLLDAVIRLYRHDFGILVRIAAVVHIPLGLIQVASSVLTTQGLDPETANPTLTPDVIAGGAGIFVYVLLFFLTMPVVQGAMAKAVAQSHLGEEPSVWGAYQFALRRWFPLLMATVLQGLAQMAAMFVPLVPAGVLIGSAIAGSSGDFPDVGVAAILLGFVGFMIALGAWTVMFLKLFFGPLTVVLEDQNPIECLARSWNLTNGHLIRVGLTMLIVVVLTVVLTYIVVIPVQLGGLALQFVSPAGGQALSGIGAVFAQLFLQPIQIVATVLLYYDLRMRKEGFDLVMMAEQIGEPQLATYTPRGRAQPTEALYGPPPQPPPPPPPPNGASNEPTDSDQLQRS